MGCSSSKTPQEDVQMQQWVNSVEQSFSHGASLPVTPKTAHKQTILCTLQTRDDSLQHPKMESLQRRDLRSLLHNDKPSLSDDGDSRVAPPHWKCEELTEANSAKNPNISKVSVEVRNVLLKSMRSNAFDMPRAKQEFNEYIAMAYADYRRKSVRLQTTVQDTRYVTQRNGTRFTIEDVLKCSPSTRRASGQGSLKYSGERFRVQPMKKQKSVLSETRPRNTNDRNDRKVFDAIKRGCFRTRRSCVDSNENKDNGIKAVPKQPESNRSARMKAPSYGASLVDNLEQDSSRKLCLDDSLSLEQFKAGDTENLTFLPSDLQSNGSARYYSNSYDTAEEEFPGDDFSQESEAVSVSNLSGDDLFRESEAIPVISVSDVHSLCKKKTLIEAQNSKLPSLTMSISTTEFTQFSSSPNGDPIKINKEDETQMEASLEQFETLCPPGGDEQIVLYTTSLQGIRKTYMECSSVRMVLEGFCVKIDERDISMHSGFKQELKDLLPDRAHVPRLFIKGRYIGGALEVVRLNENGILGKLLESIPKYTHRELCKGCGDVKFVPCTDCAGSCRIVREGKKVMQCPFCNENGIIRCPICC